MNEPLTKEQQELVEINHNLIYKFAKKRNVIIDDYYDILAIGLCKAATIFDKNKGEFSTVAFRCMENELCMYWRHEQRQSAVPDDMILSYDAPIGDEDSDNKGSFLDNFADSNYTHDIVIGNIMSDILLSVLNDKEKTIVEFLDNGLSQVDIAIRLGCTRQNISYCIKQIGKKWNTYLATN